MKGVKVATEKVDIQPYYLRKLARSGSSRYLSVGTMLPKDWEAVKVYVQDLDSQGCILKIVVIR